tara:strand:+ start:119 stop:502 length:384 start_codon:yes stop_codon:yes gene_type:complete
MIDTDINLLYKNFNNYSLKERHHILKKHNLSGRTSEKLDKLNDIHKNDMHYHGINKLDLLTMISIISFPIILITGYFGMNFKDMGVHTRKGGYIYNIKNPNIKVIVVYIIISCILLFHYKYVNIISY